MEWTDPTKLARQMIGFQRGMFENTFNTIVVLQDQTERMTSTLVDQAEWFPKEGRDAINDWIKSYKKGRDEYRKTIDKAFNNMEIFFV